MSSVIAILDDELPRVHAMQAALRKRLPNYPAVFFLNAHDAIAWFRQNLSQAALISLDHDLFPQTPEEPDPGTGRDVADYLASRDPVCRVIIHTTNAPAAVGMGMELEESGWVHSRVVPYNDLEWVEAWWIREAVEHVQ